jgi:hypothetical protein
MAKKTSPAQLRAQTKYESKPEQVNLREARNRARYAMMKAGKVRKGDGKDVDHKNMNPLDNSKGNLRVQPKSVNRKRNAHGGKTK